MQPPRGRGLRRPLVPVAQGIQIDDMRRLGLRRTKAMAMRFNRHAAPDLTRRRHLFEEDFDALVGPLTHRVEMADGFAIDESRSLPHIDALLEQGEQMVERWGGRRWEFEKPYLQNINPETAIDEYPALLDFITTPEVTAAAAPTFGHVPSLSGILPRGVRLMESSTKFDPDADDPPRESQLYHLDYHSTPTVYVIVALRDIGPDDGPLHFLGAAASRRVAEALDYGARGVPYRLRDERVMSVAEPSEVHRFSMPKGTVLFIESSACFHFGSRRPANDRYQVQYAFTSPVRSDFLELWRPQRVYPVGESDSELRRLVLGRTAS